MSKRQLSKGSKVPDCRPLKNLPENLWKQIFKQLNCVDRCKYRAVCKKWSDQINFEDLDSLFIEDLFGQHQPTRNMDWHLNTVLRTHNAHPKKVSFMKEMFHVWINQRLLDLLVERCPDLEVLDLYTAWMDGKNFQIVQKFPQLRFLRFCAAHISIDDKDVAKMAPFIQSLGSKFTFMAIPQTMCSTLVPSAQYLNTLHLMHPCGDDEIKTVGFSCMCLEEFKFGIGNLKEFTWFHYFPRLKRLLIDAVFNLDFDRTAFYTCIPFYLSQLEVLQITPECVPSQVTYMASFKELHTFLLRPNLAQQSEIEKFPVHDFNDTFCRMNDSHLCMLAYYGKLESIELLESDISDHGLIDLAQRSNIRLKSLKLTHFKDVLPFGGFFVESLADNCPNLEMLDLRWVQMADDNIAYDRIGEILSLRDARLPTCGKRPGVKEHETLVQRRCEAVKLLQGGWLDGKQLPGGIPLLYVRYCVHRGSIMDKARECRVVFTCMCE